MLWVTAIDLYTEWMRAGGTRPGTITKRRYQLSRFAEEHLGESPWIIRTDQLVEWLSRYDWQPETRRSYRAAIRSFYAWARLTAQTETNPAEVLPRIRAPKGLPRPTPDQVLDAAMGRATDRDRLMLTCAAYAGMRRSEIATARWDWFGDTHVRITGKGGHTRSVPLHPRLAAEAHAELARRGVGGHGTGYRYTAGLDEYLFPGQAGQPMHPDVIGKIITRVLGAPGWTAHTLRHRFLTRAYVGGGRDILAVQQLAGHSSLTTTQRYTQIPDGALFDAVAAV